MLRVFVKCHSVIMYFFCGICETVDTVGFSKVSFVRFFLWAKPNVHNPARNSQMKSSACHDADRYVETETDRYQI